MIRLGDKLRMVVAVLHCVLSDAVFLDLETTGINEKTEKIIEIGAVKVRGGQVVDEYHTLINPGRKVPLTIFKLCRGLTEEELLASPALEEVRYEFLAFLGNLPLVCHNAAFEEKFLREYFKRDLKNSFLDTCELACILEPQLSMHNLDFLIKNLLEEDRDESHRALDDARDTLQVVNKLFIRLEKNGSRFLDFCVDYMAGTGWGWWEYLEVFQRSRKHLTLTYDEKPASFPSKVIISPKTPDFVQCAEYLKEESKWKPEFPDYAFRPYQEQMVKRLQEVFENNQVFCLEAPTGSGKTLAYLLVAVLWAVYYQETVFISTNTKNLQQQIIENELPNLLKALQIEGFRYMTLKGMNNYACRNKIKNQAGVLRNAPFTERLAYLYLYHWSERTRDGELAELSFWLTKQLPELNELASLVRCDKGDCADRECQERYRCFYQRKRQDLGDAQLVVINHSLLMTWPPVYPRIKRLIIDEAHSIEEKAFKGNTIEISSLNIKLALKKYYDPVRSGGIFFNLIRHYLRFYQERTQDLHGETRLMVKEIQEAVKRLGEGLNEVRLSDNYDPRYNSRIAVPPEKKGLWDEVEVLAGDVSSGLEKLASRMEELVKETGEKDSDFTEKVLYSQTEECIKSLRLVARDLRDCLDTPDEDWCYYVEIMSSGGWGFYQTPVDISHSFFRQILEPVRSCVLVSATLAYRGSFERLKTDLGLSLLAPERLTEGLVIDHVYDYASNCVLAIPTDQVPLDNRRPEAFVEYTAGVVFEIASLLHGRTLVLFSSNRRMRDVYYRIVGPLEEKGIRLYAMGINGGSGQKMLDLLKEEDGVVVMGSKSFWEGIDVKGQALSCVIIEKVPFSNPDPFFEKRKKVCREQGLNPFLKLSLPEAGVSLRQQFGRLIRSKEDRGYVLVLNQLVEGNKYYNVLIRDLPPARLLVKTTGEILAELKKDFTCWGCLP